MEQVEYEVMAAVERDHWWYGGMRAVSSVLIERVYPRAANLRILDAGCGSAGNAPFLQRYGEVVGLDLEPLALRYGQANLPGRVVCGSVQNLPYQTGSFDLVTSFDVLYHMQVADEVAALQEFWRVLRPGGRLLIRLPAFELLKSKHDRLVHTRRRYRLADLRQIVDEAGFLVEFATYANSLLFLPRLLQRMLHQALPALERNESDLMLGDRLLNDLLRLPLALEARWLARGGRFPLGTSVICLARKELDGDDTARPHSSTSIGLAANSDLAERQPTLVRFAAGAGVAGRAGALLRLPAACSRHAAS